MTPRVLCRITFLPTDHKNVWWTNGCQMLSRLTNFKCVFDLKWATNSQTHMWHILHSFVRHNSQYQIFYDFMLHFFPVHPYFYPSKTGFTCPHDGWTGLCIKLQWHPFLKHNWQHDFWNLCTFFTYPLIVLPILMTGTWVSACIKLHAPV